nr:MAG TPA: hypothetical protein [Caudoviricetes sp.]
MQAEHNVCQVCLNRVAEAQSLFCKERCCFMIADYESLYSTINGWHIQHDGIMLHS